MWASARITRHSGHPPKNLGPPSLIYAGISLSKHPHLSTDLLESSGSSQVGGGIFRLVPKRLLDMPGIFLARHCDATREVVRHELPSGGCTPSSV